MPLPADRIVLKHETGERSPLAHAGPVADEESLAISDGGFGRDVIGRGSVRCGGACSTLLLLGLDGRKRLVGRGVVLQGRLGLLLLLVFVGRGNERALGIGGRQVLLMTLASLDDGLELEGGQLALLDDVSGHGEVVCAMRSEGDCI